METLKFIFFLTFFLALIGLGGYWAVTTMQSSSDYVKNQKIKTLENENISLKKDADELKNKITVLENSVSAAKVIENPPAEAPVPALKKPTTTTSTTYKNQTLINELQRLIKDKISMKLNSKGTRVGTVQKFLNVYNKTSNKVNNLYDANTKSSVTDFQKNEGLVADGEAGASTFEKMIDWLKKQG